MHLNIGKRINIVRIAQNAPKIMHLNVGKRIVFGYLLLIVLICIISLISIFEFSRAGNYSEALKSTYFARYSKAEQVVSCIWQEVASIRGFVITGDQTYFDEYKAASTESANLEKSLLDGCKTDQELRLAQDVKMFDESYCRVVEEKIVPLVQQGKTQEAMLLNKRHGMPLAKQMEARIEEFSTLLENQMVEQTIVSQQNLHQAMTIVIVISILAIILVLLASFYIPRSIIKPLNSLVKISSQAGEGDLTQRLEINRNDEFGALGKAFNQMIENLGQLVKHASKSSEYIIASSEQLAVASEQSTQAATNISTSMTDVAQGITKESESIDEASAVIEQMSASIQEVAEAANSTANLTDKSANATRAGQQIMQNVISQMNCIEDTTGKTQTAVQKLAASSEKIGEIVGIISDIASQTNLLALNAAIEAARAGEHGRGFAVVADEVRKLAEQSQDAAKQITDLVNDNIADIESAVLNMNSGVNNVNIGKDLADEAGRSFEEITASVLDASNRINAISVTIGQMVSGTQNIVSSVEAINAISKNTAAQTQSVSAATEEQSASMEEIASSSQNLAAMAQELQNVINKFKI